MDTELKHKEINYQKGLLILKILLLSISQTQNWLHLFIYGKVIQMSNTILPSSFVEIKEIKESPSY